jgi:signal transduction histidine kinase
MLSERGYIIRKAINGQMALQSVHTTLPDMILLDINMPDMNGYEVCKQLKANEQTANIPVIFLSALDEVLDKVKAFNVGGVDYLTKPFQLEELLARIKNHLTIQRQQKLLAEQNALLKEEICKRQQTEAALIQSEKMAALGQLIAGIAHEVNTPIGAIRASISNIVSATDTSLEQLPKLLQQLSPNQIADFMALIDIARNNQQLLSSREERQLRRTLKKELETQGLTEAESIADSLVLMGITTGVTRFLPLLNDRHKDLILEVANSISSQIRNSQNILQAVERASKIVFALKSYAREGSAGEMVRANISQGIDIVLTLYQNQWKQGIEVVREYQQVPEILCNPEQLNQVWTNLIHNAIQAMNNRGKLEINVFSQAGEIVVQITDSGCGIPPEIKEKIFKPFFTTKPAGEGTGLGLDIVNNIIKLHQGKIEVESKPGQTTFSVLLPVK